MTKSTSRERHPSALGSTKEQVEHYVCCRVPDTYVGFTVTFCGLNVLMDHKGVGLTACKQCANVATRPGCPIGHDCEPVD